MADFSAVNEIIRSFASGLAQREEINKRVKDEAFRREQLDAQKAENAARLKQQQDELAQAAELHKASQAHQTAELELQQKQFDVAKIAAGINLGKNYSETGILPGGYTEDQSKMQSLQVSPGLAGMNHYFASQDPNLPTFQAPDPETQALLQARQEALKNAPLYEQQRVLRKIDNEAKEKAAVREDAARLKQYQDTNAMRLEIAKLTNASRASRATVQENRDARPLTSQELYDFGTVDERGNISPLAGGTTQGELRGVYPNKRITAPQEKYLGSLNSLEDSITEFQNLFEGPNAKLKYSDYYQGTGKGTFKELVSNVPGTLSKELAEARRLAADIQLKAKEAENLGAALSGIEKPILVSTAPSPDRGVASEIASAIVPGYLKSVQRTRSNFLKAALGVKPIVNLHENDYDDMADELLKGQR